MLGKMTVPFTLEEYYQGLNVRLGAATTMVFVDTNILAYSYRLFSEARRELLDWFGEIRAQNRLHVPAWVANEYFVRTSTANLTEFLPKIEARSSLVQLEEQLQIARLALDDTALRRRAVNRDDLIRNLEAAIAALRPHLEAMTVDRRQVPAVHDEVEATFGDCVLRSDIARLCVEASATAAHRVLHRLPPGFEDSGKKLNPWGDLILWKELLEFVQRTAPRPRHVVLLTNDEKRDWSYAPRHRRRTGRDGALGIENNEDPEVRLTDPRLVQEFCAHLGDRATEFEVVSIRHVIASLARAAPGRFRLLSVALQLQVAQDAHLVGGGLPPQAPSEHADVGNQEPPQPGPGGAAPVAPGVPDVAPPIVDEGARVPEAVEQPELPEGPAEQAALPVGEQALADAQYHTDASTSAIDKVIDALRSHNWYAQNPAIGRIAALAQSAFSSDAWFVLGRNVYQAACGSAYEAIEYLKHLSARLGALPATEANAMFGGMLFEVYFDNEGALRRGNFKVTYLDDLVRITQTDRYGAAIRFINERLAPHREAIAEFPNNLTRLPVIVDAEQVVPEGNLRGYWQLHNLLLGGRSVVKPGDNFETDGVRENDLRELLGQKYGLPPRFLDVAFNPPEASKSRVFLRADRVLKTAAEIFAESE